MYYSDFTSGKTIETSRSSIFSCLLIFLLYQTLVFRYVKDQRFKAVVVRATSRKKKEGDAQRRWNK